ncbi:LysM peptidoglycan-binding domain-containing protein [Nannocystis pusilla]|uniref:LysM peptidoglycan-binding domain-containing protein n=1 Tax=Nannocystis pusilla TaxID=889268 RepID=UPI003B8002A3
MDGARDGPHRGGLPVLLDPPEAEPRGGRRGRLPSGHRARAGAFAGAAGRGQVEVDEDEQEADEVRFGEKPKGDPRCGGKTPIWEHKVKSGDNLGRIAGQYGVRMSDITRLNPKLKKNPDKLSIGQIVLVCPDPEVPPHLEEEGSYTVKKGDSLSEIAEKHHMKVGELIALQKGSLRKRLDANKSDLRPGDELTIMIDRGIIAAFAPTRMRIAACCASASRWIRASTITSSVRTWPSGQAPRSRRSRPRSRSTRCSRASRAGRRSTSATSARAAGAAQGPQVAPEGRRRRRRPGAQGADAGEVRFLSGNADNLDVARTWALIKSFVDTKEVRAIFLDYGLQKVLYEHAKKKGVSEAKLDELFQYPRGKGRGYGIIRHWKGHRDHFHVRFHR